MGVKQINDYNLQQTGFSNVFFDKESWFGLSSSADEGVLVIPCNFQRLTFGSDQMYNFFMSFPATRLEYTKMVTLKEDYNLTPGTYEYMIEDDYDIALVFLADKLVGKDRDTDDQIMLAFEQAISGLSLDYNKGEVFRLPIINVGDIKLTQRLLYILSLFEEHTWIVHTK